MVFNYNTLRNLYGPSGALMGGMQGYYNNLPQRIPQRQAYMGTRTRTVTTKGKRRNGVRNSFKKLMLNNTSAKHDTNGPLVVMLHNLIYTFNATSLITQGTTNEGRLGDAINLEALKIRGYYNSATTDGAYMFRMIIGYSGEEITTGNVFVTVTGLTAGQIFLPNAPANITAIVNPKAFTVLHEEVIDINSQIAGSFDVASIAKTVLLKQKFDYQDTGSIFGKTKNLYIVIVAHVVGGVAGTTAAGECVLGTDLIFK